MAAALHSLVYVSSATGVLSPDQLRALQEQARAGNRERGITGLLLFCEGSFMQVLEGGRSTVDQVYRRIGRDPRHHHLIELVSEPILQRDFADWEMAFSTATAPEFLALTRADWRARAAASGEARPSRGRRMLREFWTACRRT
jgi:hypothetical protein